MARIRSLSDLQNEMSAEFAWRKKELSRLKGIVYTNKQTHDRDLFVRAAVPLLYAHWEGFIKRIGTAYLEYVASRRLRNDELATHLLALTVGQLVRSTSESSKFQPCMDLVEFFRTQAASRCKLDWKTGIKTKSNLKSFVLKEIVATLGLDYSRFATKEKLIDERLLANRNTIAHGHYLLIDFDSYMDLHGEILTLMIDFYNQVENAAMTGAYRR